MEEVAALFRFSLLVGGVTYILTRSAIFAVYRTFLGSLNLWIRILVYCPACTGFWVGLAFYWRWPWLHGVAMVEPAIAGCVIGSVLNAAWGDAAVTAELEALNGSAKEEQDATD